MTIDNLHDNGIVHSGFVVGSAAAATKVTVEVALDGGAFAAAKGSKHWNFKLPTGLATWKDNSAHTIAVRATDTAGNTTTATVNVRKGNNQDVNGDGFPISSSAIPRSAATAAACISSIPRARAACPPIPSSTRTTARRAST